jgi:hypothetical protein
MAHRFGLQDTWLGCNGVVSLFAFALAIVLAAIGFVLLAMQRRAS